MTRRKPRPTEAAIVGKDIVIRLPIDDIAGAIEDLENWGRGRLPYDFPIKVTDPKVFAKEVCRFLNKEEEDGTTLIHELFDKGFWGAAEDGSLGCEVGRFNDDGEAVFDPAAHVRTESVKSGRIKECGCTGGILGHSFNCSGEAGGEA